MDLVDDIRPRQIQDFGAVLLPPIIALDIEVHRLDTASRAAIAQQTASLWLGPANKKQVDWN